MKKDVMVCVKAIHKDESGAEEIIETKSRGQYLFKGDSEIVMYEENREESGFDKSMLRFSAEHISVTKKNKAEGSSVNMTFRAGEKTQTIYGAVGGGLQMSFDTRCFSLERSEDSISIRLKYIIEMNGNYISENDMYIDIISC